MFVLGESRQLLGGWPFRLILLVATIANHHTDGGKDVVLRSAQGPSISARVAIYRMASFIVQLLWCCCGGRSGRDGAGTVWENSGVTAKSFILRRIGI